MKHRYTRDCPRPVYDDKITDWLNTFDDDDGMMSYPVAIYHGGYIYRVITGHGMSEYVSIRNFLGEIGLVNLIDDTATFRGYDAVLASPEVKTAMADGTFRMTDIPKNTAPVK
ncbi:hypothetical protein S700_004847 [Salmonella enterica subsp. enterica]|uniref:Uncharacterized protein n=7 Tax=Salmonella enterica TaxID=28901 RepID=A0A5I0Y456_SALET|nr:hypothetical protein [Salmonella enterica]EAA9073916.1 hypothetical protein [Salmonella enterica subsp. enterica]EAB5377443.1 hypothetical protein [Salmonella enterica subsp. enterica serovar Brunei]EAW1719515.1 hypothetical protein [Salmonella enterica subsp. indica]EBF8287871.1 hypothetical protein [Salmonella enterica subsp. houtenae]EBG8260687.1 hypothetical protein [Salmonella enterica subsp. enterica serovar Java]EBH9883821.1 hypothetical protein [Salmonella enterica subsp. enterica 